MQSGKSRSMEAEEMLRDHETPILKKRLVASLGFLIVLMYFSMGHMMWNWPLSPFFEGNHVAMGLFQMLLTISIMVINQKFFISGFKSLWHNAPNMDTLVALGSAASFIYSVYALFAMSDAQVRGDMEAVMYFMDEFYFESAAEKPDEAGTEDGCSRTRRKRNRGFHRTGQKGRHFCGQAG